MGGMLSRSVSVLKTKKTLASGTIVGKNMAHFLHKFYFAEKLYYNNNRLIDSTITGSLAETLI